MNDPLHSPARDATGKPIDVKLLRQWIGREDVLEEVLSETLIHRFRVCLGLPEPAASALTVAPRMIHYCLGQRCDAVENLGTDGHTARGRFLPPVPLERRMWAGSEYRFSGDFGIGDRVKRRSRVADVIIKDGRNGPLCFVQVDHSYEVNGQTIVEERQNLVYLATLSAHPSAPATDPARRGTHQCRLDSSAVTLFRYSALTFNGHRIHYDAPYAVNVEGLAGLVVHAPLQATLLYHFAVQLGGSPPDHFAFRSASTLYDHDHASLHADAREGDVQHLWSCRTGGPVATKATAMWRQDSSSTLPDTILQAKKYSDRF